MTITPWGYDNIKTVTLTLEDRTGIAVTTGQAFVAFPPGPSVGDWIRDDAVFNVGPDWPAEDLDVADSTVIAYPATFQTIGSEPSGLIGWGVDTATSSYDPNKSGQVQITARIVALNHSSFMVRIGFQLTTTFAPLIT